MHAGLNKGEARNSLAGGVLQPPWGNQDRSFEQQRYRASGLNFGDGGYRAVEHGVPGTRHPGVGRGRQAGGRRAAAIPVAAGLGAHQPNWRLRLAAEPQTGRREVSALTDARKTLAYDFSEFCGLPVERFCNAATGLRQLDGQLQVQGAQVRSQPAASMRRQEARRFGLVHRGVPALLQHPLNIPRRHRPRTFRTEGGQHNQHPPLQRRRTSGFFRIIVLVPLRNERF